MKAFEVRRSLVFAREAVSRVRAGWWSAVVYNFCRVNRALRVKLEVAVGRQKFLERSPAFITLYRDDSTNGDSYFGSGVECAGGVAHASLWVEGCSVIRIIHDNYRLQRMPYGSQLETLTRGLLKYQHSLSYLDKG
jgi:hypothetical protein